MNFDGAGARGAFDVRVRIRNCGTLLALLVASSGTLAGSAAAADTARAALPRPPGFKLVTLPRQPGEKHQEPAVAIDHRDPRHVIVSFHQAVGDGSDHDANVRVTTHVAATFDGGATWAVANNAHKLYSRSLDASTAIDAQGGAYVIYIGMDEMSFVTPTTRHGEFVHRSMDGGRKWDAEPVTVIERPEEFTKPIFEHMPKIVADTFPGSPNYGRLYAVWDRLFMEPGKNPPHITHSEVTFTTSKDRGKTWSAPRPIGVHSADITLGVAVGRDGAVYVMQGVSKRDSYELLLSVSHDGGQTFGAALPVTRTVAKTAPVANFPRPGLNGRPAIGIDPRSTPGRLFIVWGDLRNGDRDIFSISSADAGRTWSEPVRVNDDAKGNGKDQIMSWLAVDPTDGSANVLFYDRRDDPANALSGMTLARSADGGRTFTNYSWSDKASDARKASLGDYIGIAASGGRVYGAWPEDVVEPPKQTGRKASQEAKAGEPPSRGYPSGPSAMRIGIADFRVKSPPAR